ncbi:MAG: xanthine dehydrogenase family protein molybdopterin-binding subunit [Saprospiraceae bacterium]|nr:xanthine dehydrogenase family protein molybdopterin-binding subunit [Saprospiraceae bacterium]
MKDLLKSLPIEGRRSFVKQLGTLMVSFPLTSPILWPSYGPVQEEKLPRTLQRNPSLGAWLQVTEDNRVQVFTGKIELGQSIKTVIRQVAAEELSMEMEQVEVIMANTAMTPNEGYTAGSGSVKGSAIAVRYAAAFARMHLCSLAGNQWGLERKDVHLDNGTIFSKDKKRSISIANVLGGQQSEVEVTMPIELIPKRKYRFVGRPNVSYDIEQIVRGEPYFIQDLVFPQMLHARILRPPAPNWNGNIDVAKLKLLLPEGLELFVDGKMLAIVGADEYTVVKTHRRLDRELKWHSDEVSVTDRTLSEKMKEMSTEEVEVISPTVKEDLAGATFEGTFFKPYILHGAMGPACGVAKFDMDLLEVWTHSQGVFPFRAALASLFSMPAERIIVKGEAGAGCFGHSSADDAAADAAILAHAFRGRHVRVQWTRQQEHQWEAMGSAIKIDVKATLNDQGEIVTWESEVRTDSHSTRPNKDPGTLLSARYLSKPFYMKGKGYIRGGHRNAEPYYRIASNKLVAHHFQGPLRVSSLRSLGAFANVFAIETIIDKMSRYLGEHPIDFRTKRLDDERAIAVLERLKEQTINEKTAEREGLGYAFGRYKNTDGYCALATKLSVSVNGDVTLIKCWAVVDVGEVMNPLGLEMQVEGAILQACSWTLKESVTFEGNAVSCADWNAYPILRFGNVPDFDITILDQPQEQPLGGGELATPPTPASITNAIFDALGLRIYSLPVKIQSHP